MLFSIHYTTEYRYAKPVADNLNALRVRPATTTTQRCDEFHVRIDPESRLGRHADYFGTEVIEFGVSTPHSSLTIDVRARVVTTAPGDPPDPAWSSLETAAYQEAAGEFLLATIAEPHNGSVVELFELGELATPLAAVDTLCTLIPDRFEYRRGVTYVGSTVEDLIRAGGGVCQDFVHLALILLRRRGIAARYVSGYLFASPPDGGFDSVEVDTHAWLEVLLPDGGERGEPVWVGVDPTNRTRAGEQYVKIGHGRRYDDVPPIKGVYRGGAPAELSASVVMTRLDPATSARA
ncbi:MAG TPA: transglutaminase family protein [Solirubrobacteraceae bacterium]|nr:transglutaminase family protein [Solirubrobacteraceae bacterium]